jgi:hypothetical protein
MTDISDTLAPNSDQLDAVELVGGPRTFTIARVNVTKAEQPVDVHLAEFPRPWRPGKSMRRVLAACWGAEASAWVGRRVTLYCDPDVIFGKDKVGGTRISHLSHIDAEKRIPLLVSRGKSAIFTVKPLVEAAAPTEADVAASTDPDQLRAWWKPNTHLRTAIEARVKELQTDTGAAEPPARAAAVEASGDAIAPAPVSLDGDLFEGGRS